MLPLPASWANLSEHMEAQQAMKGGSVPPESRPTSKGTGQAEAASRPTSKGTTQHAQGSSRAATPESDGATRKPEAFSQPKGSESKGLAVVKGQKEKAKGLTNGQVKPAWGAAQPPANAAQVAAARTYKVCISARTYVIWQSQAGFSCAVITWQHHKPTFVTEVKS